MKKLSKDFENKEFLLNYTNRRWGLTKTSKVGEVMALIRECQPRTFQEWENWYFLNAQTKSKIPVPVTKETLAELGERLYSKLKEIVIPQIMDSIQNLTKGDCVEYVYQVTIYRTFDGYQTEKSVIHDDIAKRFPIVSFEESDPELDHAGDIDYLGKLQNKAFGIQIKPITAQASLGNYDVSARMEQSFNNFEKEFGGKVFIIYSTEDRVRNTDVYDKIQNEIERLNSL